MDDSLREKARNIRMLLLDVDGVLTDGNIILGSDGFEAKEFDVQDGMGVTMAQEAGISVGILTGRVSEAVRRRSKELDIELVYQGHFWKDEALGEILEEHDIEKQQIAYIGDDILDLPVISEVGLPIAPNNARREVKEKCEFVTESSGGNGAIREAVEWILDHRGELEVIIEHYESGAG